MSPDVAHRVIPLRLGGRSQSGHSGLRSKRTDQSRFVVRAPRLRPWSRRRCHLLPLVGSLAQTSFESGVEIPPHLRHALIAILAKERRWPVIFKDSPALLVLEQNHPQRRVESSGELMAGHL